MIVTSVAFARLHRPGKRGGLDRWRCQCRTCECYEAAEEDSDLCLGCLHGAHPGEVE